MGPLGTTASLIVSSTPPCLKTGKILGQTEIDRLMASASFRPGKILFLSSISVNQVTKLSISFVFRRCVRKMEGLEISEMRVEPCVDSRFIRPSRVVFKQVSLYSSWSNASALYAFSNVSLDFLAP